VTKRYKQWWKKITVRPVDDPKEYARQYYWLAIKGEDKAPKRRNEMMVET
jgi:hypothetical protein